MAGMVEDSPGYNRPRAGQTPAFPGPEEAELFEDDFKIELKE
jgi:hypothetical protein